MQTLQKYKILFTYYYQLLQYYKLFPLSVLPDILSRYPEEGLYLPL